MGRDDNGAGIFFFGDGFDFSGVFVAGGQVVLADVHGIDDRLAGEEAEVFDGLNFVFGEVDGAGGVAFFEDGEDLFEGVDFRLEVFVGFGFFAGSLDALFDLGEIGEGELHVDDLDVAQGIDGFVDVGDVVVVETADDVDDGVNLADVGKELVAEAFAFTGALDEPGDVDEFVSRGEDVFGAGDFGEDFQARVGNADHADVGFDGAKGEVGRLRLGIGDDGVEEGGFPDVWQSYNSGSEHGLIRG